MAVFKPKVKEVGKLPEARVKKNSCMGHLAALVAHCSAAAFSDGTPREPGTLTIGSRAGVWRVTARDNVNNVQVSVVDSDLDTALVALDVFVGDPETPWEPMTWAGKKRQKRS